MKKLNPKKKIFLSAVALVLVAALGAGIWLGVQGGAEPVKVYPFTNVGMTEYWGDRKESYGPVSTDKIQTVFLSQTQTVTEILVSEGDEVKEGDPLLAFDTTLTELELERKRLDVEKKKLDLQTSKTELNRINALKPYDPEAVPEFPVFEPDLGDLIQNDYEISTDKKYDGSEVNLPLICWMKDGIPVNDALLRDVWAKAAEYQAANAATNPPSSGSAVPDPGNEAGGNVPAPLNETQQSAQSSDQLPEETTKPTTDPTQGTNEPSTDPTQGTMEGSQPTQGTGETSEPTPSGGQDPLEEVETKKVPITYTFNGTLGESGEVDVAAKPYTIPGAKSPNGIQTYWLKQVIRNSDNMILSTATIPAYDPNDPTWDSKWGRGVTAEYVRKVTIGCSHLNPSQVEATVQEDFAIFFAATVGSAPSNLMWRDWQVKCLEGEDFLKSASNQSILTLSGRPTKTGTSRYSVTASFNLGGYLVQETAELTVEVKAPGSQGTPGSDFYMVLKITENNLERGNRIIWQGVHVLCYDDGSFGFQLFDASSLEDHTLEPLEDQMPEMPEFDFGSGMTASEIHKLRLEQERKIKQEDLALRMAEAEYNLMQAEVNDGKIYAEFDGKVVGLLSEEEARESNRPVLKLSAGGGFYIDCSVSELEKDNMDIGQEVTIDDWNTGMTYTGKVDSLGDFPVNPNGWSSSENMNASYYPFTVFVDSEADLQAGSYVNVTYSSTEGQAGLYLENPFLREEEGRHYVLVKGADNKLEKRYVKVGKSLYGSYTQILSGLTEEDWLAFPYGKEAKPGAAAEESTDISELYGY